MADSGCEDTVPTLSTMVPACKLPEESDASMRARLFTSLSQSFPHSQLYKALHGGEDINLNGGDNSEDDDDSLYGDPLSNSCFASLRMDRRDSDDFDDDLRSLEWLQNEDLLKNIGGEKLDKEEDDNGEQKENEDIKPDITLLQSATGQQPSNLSYLPQKHVNSKPPYSFSCLIFMAVEASPQKRLPVKDIYNWILTQFPYFQNAPTGWKNSVRHNLSLNKCFKKVEKDKGQSIGKGSLWCIDPAYRPNLLQALRKTPYHPYHQLQMTSTQPQNYVQYQSLPGGGRTVLPLTQRPVPNTVSPHLFPFLSRRLAQTSFDVDNEMKDVAQTLVALKGSYRNESPDSSSGEDIGPTWKHKKHLRRPSSPVVVTDYPYDDHAYSSTRVLDDDAPSPSSSSSIDEEYDFGDADEECDSEYNSDMEWGSDNKDDVDGDLPSNKKLKIDVPDDTGKMSTSGKVVDESEDDEQKKIHEGASALLNLAGLLLNHRNSSTSPDAGTPEKKKDNHREREKRGEKKRRIVKKKRNADKKSTVIIPKTELDDDEDKSPRKRSVSRRKNAGSNGRYNAGEYSLIKPGKAGAKSRSSSATNLQAIFKSEPIKSVTGTDSNKVTSSTTKNKQLKKKKSKKIAKKGSAGKQKLKLSKTFGSSNKSVSSFNDKIVSITDNKAHKTLSNISKSKNSLSKKDKTKDMKSSSPIKRSNASTDNSNSSKNISIHENGHVLSGSTKQTPFLDNASIVNNKDAKKSATLNEKSVHSDLQNHGDNISNVNPSSAEASLVNGEIISPAGDTSSKSKEVLKVAETASDPKALEPFTKDNDSGDHISKSVGRRSSPSRHNLSDLSPATSAHKSPHFTRFSKKKAALS